MVAGGWTRGGPEQDDGKHSLEWLELRWESVSLLNRGVLGDWGGAVKDSWDVCSHGLIFLSHFQKKTDFTGVLVQWSSFLGFVCFLGGPTPDPLALA